MEHEPIPAPPRIEAISVRAMEDIMAERHRQIQKFGHTPEQDVAAHRDAPSRVPRLSRIAARTARDAGEDLQFGKLETARKHAIQSAATALALVEMIDNLMEAENG
ncbi:hypothetical protein [Croceicoccus mobilis]|uniref:Uncharacterized protein n=1 Tax=Croceicoccus mobilis TaxID=1703339 RepID=A0A916Z3D0_9SPHN|nr:hypothetical protein [Croceicoccus mobilis]GGD74087.1 hypothetical protein GCM10010990_24660 [Croceicoccus mobilis]